MADLRSSLDRLLELWHSPAEEAFATLPGGTLLPIASRRFAAWLHQQGFAQQNVALSWKQVQDLQHYYASRALYSNCHNVYHRICRQEGRILLDREGVVEHALSHSLIQKGRYVEITADGWQILDKADARFVVRSSQGRLPEPIKGGKLPELLEPFLPFKEEKQVALVVAWLIGALYGEYFGAEFPILLLTGAAESGKSTVTRICKNIIDPSTIDTRDMPTSGKDFIAAAKNNYVLSFDNISKLNASLSDRLCMLATGQAGFAQRELYTNSNEVGFKATRPLILNGISNFVERNDLATRTFSIAMPTMSEEEKRSSLAIQEHFKHALPAILGALYDCAAAALRNFSSIRLTSPPRMATFAQWVIAAEEMLSYPKGFILEAIMENRQGAAEHLIENDPVAQAIYSLVEKTGHFCGTYAELQDALLPYRSLDGEWPKTPRGLSGWLARVKPALRLMKVEITPQGRRRREGGTGMALVQIKKA